MKRCLAQGQHDQWLEKKGNASAAASYWLKYYRMSISFHLSGSNLSYFDSYVALPEVFRLFLSFNHISKKFFKDFQIAN